MLARQELIDYIRAHYQDMSALEMSKATGENISRIYGIGYALNIRFIKKRTQRPNADFCRDRPECCYNCPLPECVCNENLSDGEAAYLFIGHGDDKKQSKKLNAIAE